MDCLSFLFVFFFPSFFLHQRRTLSGVYRANSQMNLSRVCLYIIVNNSRLSDIITLSFFFPFPVSMRKLHRSRSLGASNPANKALTLYRYKSAVKNISFHFFYRALVNNRKSCHKEIRVGLLR